MEVKGDQIVEQYVHRVRDNSASFASKLSVCFQPNNIIGPPKNLRHLRKHSLHMFIGLKSCCERWWLKTISCPDEMRQNDKIQSLDYIEVSYKEPVYPTEVFVYESINPGAVRKIWALGPTSWVLLWDRGNITLKDEMELLLDYYNPPIKQIDFPTQILRLEFGHEGPYYGREGPYFEELSAVLLKGYKPKIVNIERPSLLSTKSHPAIEQGALVGGKCEELSTSVSVDASVDEGPQGTGFHSLPEEMVLKVFKYFDMPTLSRCAQVNKQFYRAASDATLHKRMNFRPYWHSLRSGALLALAPHCRLLQRLDLSWCGSHLMIAPEAVVSFLKETGGNLTHLRMNNCKFVNNSVLEAIVRYAPNLKELSLRSVTDCMRWSVLQRLEKLERLDLYGTMIKTEVATAVVMANPKLRHLNLGCCFRILDMDKVIYALLSNCQDLTSVDILLSSASDDGYSALKQSRKLRYLGFYVYYKALNQDDSSEANSAKKKKIHKHKLYLYM